MNPVAAATGWEVIRTFDRRIESLFLLADHQPKQHVIHILDYNLRDNVNAYQMQEEGDYDVASCPLYPHQ